MEKFMLIFHGGQTDEMSPDEMQQHMSRWMSWVGQLSEKGTYLSGEALIPGGKLLSGAAGKMVTDGPYTEGKEVVGGYFVIKAADMDEAVRIAKDCPDFNLGGSVQVRQVMNFG